MENKSPSVKTDTPWWRKIGPGLITGAADDDPSGIATYSQAGAKFGFDLLWSLLLTFPLMVAIQIISARIGATSGHGLATHIKARYPRWFLMAIVASLCIANTINIGADIAAMGDASTLLIGGLSARWVGFGLGVVSLLLQIAIPYRRYVNILKWLTLVLFSYVATVFVQDVEWSQVFQQTISPHWHWRSDYFAMLVAVFGTTISPYLFFWQSSEEVEELHRQKLLPLKQTDNQIETSHRLKSINIDTLFGMTVSNVVAFFIMLSTALALHAHGITRIQTSAEAARALLPIAGHAAFLLFTLGIIGTGMLAVPVLAASCAYAVSGVYEWPASLEHRFSQAPHFYSVIAGVMLIGGALCFTPIKPIDALYWSAIVNGVVAVPLIAIMVKMAIDSRVMGRYGIGPLLQILAWLTMAIMGATTVAMFF